MASLKRPIYPMPADVEHALAERHLADAYAARPHYQRNDYIGWIERAKRHETRAKRLAQMLDELEGGTLYMNMPWHPAQKQTEQEQRGDEQRAATTSEGPDA